MTEIKGVKTEIKSVQTDFEGLQTAVIKGGPAEIDKRLSRIPEIHLQEALDIGLEKAIMLTRNPKLDNIRHLLALGANPNGPIDEQGILLCFSYTSKLYDVVELLLQAKADPNIANCDVLEQAVRNDDLPWVIRFVQAGADPKDTDRLLFSENLVKMTKDKQIQKFLISKGAPASKKLIKSLEQVQLPKSSEFTYPKVGIISVGQTKSPTQNDLEICDYSETHCVLRGNTKAIQGQLRRLGGRFYPNLLGGKGWKIPITKKDFIEQTFFEKQEISDSPEDEEETEIDHLIKNIVDKCAKATVPEVSDYIGVWGNTGLHDFLSSSFTRKQLFHLYETDWDSVERFIMYKMYEGTPKGEAIKNAETLADARNKFQVTNIQTAKTPKQLMLNHRLGPIAKSTINSGYLNNRERLFELATTAKFKQNTDLKIALKKLAGAIVSLNPLDIGYEGNLLGNVLMKLRELFGGPIATQFKTNNLTFNKYNDVYVIRGDPDKAMLAQIKAIASHKLPNGKVVNGKLNLNLKGGPGWLIPGNNKNTAKKLVFSSYPDEKKIQECGKDWIKNRTHKILEIAILFSQLREKQEVGSDDIHFAIKDVFGSTEFGTENGKPATEFVQMVWKYTDRKEAVISDSAIQILWNVVSELVREFTRGVNKYVDMKDLVENLEYQILDTLIETISGLTERESIVIQAFNHLYRLLKRASNKESKICVTAVHMMLSQNYYLQVRRIYAEKSKLGTHTSGYADDEEEYRRRFLIKNPHLKAVLRALPKDLSKKCVLLVLTLLDYVMELTGDAAMTVSKRLILISKKSLTPTPVKIEEMTDINELNQEISDIPRPSKSPGQSDGRSPGSKENSPAKISESPKESDIPKPSKSPSSRSASTDSHSADSTPDSCSTDSRSADSTPDSHSTDSHSTDSSPDNTPNRTPKNTPNRTPKNTPKRTPKDTPKKTSNDTPKKTPKDTPKKTPKDTPKRTPKDTPKRK